ncbi:uncharacterized protein TNCV_5027931 [Trichonephila clavipes]|nr:uncharacterized protein TNCV_5027931 [Trichonephila clavipes]
MVSDGTEFAVGDIERLFDEARRNTKAKHEKWEKYNRRRRNVQIKVNDWVLIKTHPLSSATKKVVAKFKPKFEGPYRVKETLGYKRSCDSGSGGPGRKQRKGQNHHGEKRQLTLTRKSELQGPRKKYRGDEVVMPITSGYNLRPRNGARVKSRPIIEMKTQQGGPVRARNSRGKHYRPYIEEQAR